VKNKTVVSYAIKLLSSKDYSEEELKEKLLKYHGKEKVENLLIKFKQKKLLNDRELAGNIVRNYFRRGKGIFYIESVLRRRKLSETIISSIKSAFDFQREYKIAEKYFLKHTGKKRFSSLIFSLKSKGFSFQTLGKLREKYGKQ